MKHYKTLDTIPHWNFRMAMSKAMPQFCRVGFDEYSEGEITKEDLEAFELLKNEHEKLYGINKLAIELDRLQNKLSLLKQDLFITKQKMLENDIYRIEVEIMDLLEAIPESDVLHMERLCLRLQKWFGQPVNERKMSVIRFNLLIDEANADIERQIAAVNNYNNG